MWKKRLLIFLFYVFSPHCRAGNSKMTTSHIFYFTSIYLYKDTYIQSNFATIFFSFWITGLFFTPVWSILSSTLAPKNNLFNFSSAYILSSFSVSSFLLCINFSSFFFSLHHSSGSFPMLISTINMFLFSITFQGSAS